MRVALVTSAYPPHIGGVERHSQHLARCLAGLGCEVEVLTQGRSVESASAVQEREGLIVRRFPVTFGSKTAPVALGLFKYLRQTQGRYEIIHAHNYHSAAPAMSFLSGCHPLVVSTYLHARPATVAARAAHVPYGVLGRRLLRSAAAVIALSRSEADLVADRVPGVHPVVIPSGIDVSRLRAAEAKEKTGPVVMFVGRLTAYKGAVRVLEALPYFGGARLVMIGSGPDAAILQRLADGSGSRQTVQLLGAVEDEELASWYATADVVVSFSAYESFGIAVLEGLAAGSRVVASDIPAHRDLRQFDEHGALHLVPLASSPEEIGKAVCAGLAIGRCLPSTMVPRWEAIGQDHLQLYERALELRLASWQ